MPAILHTVRQLGHRAALLVSFALFIVVPIATAACALYKSGISARRVPDKPLLQTAVC